MADANLGDVARSFYKGEKLGLTPACAICVGKGQGTRAQLHLPVGGVGVAYLNETSPQGSGDEWSRIGPVTPRTPWLIWVRDLAMVGDVMVDRSIRRERLGRSICAGHPPSGGGRQTWGSWPEGSSSRAMGWRGERTSGHGGSGERQRRQASSPSSRRRW